MWQSPRVLALERPIYKWPSKSMGTSMPQITTQKLRGLSSTRLEQAGVCAGSNRHRRLPA